MVTWSEDCPEGFGEDLWAVFDVEGPGFFLVESWSVAWEDFDVGEEPACLVEVWSEDSPEVFAEGFWGAFDAGEGPGCFFVAAWSGDGPDGFEEDFWDGFGLKRSSSW